MTNHTHLLVSAQQPGNIVALMKAVGQRYAQYVNWRHRRSGSLWQGRYKACPVQTERYLLVCQRYIELNPVRAHLCSHPGRYRWSSYRANAEGQADKLVTPHELYLRMGVDPSARQEAYRALFLEALNEGELDTIRSALNHESVLGDQVFLTQSRAKAGVGPGGSDPGFSGF